MTKRINGEGSIFTQKRKRKDGTEYEINCGEIIVGYNAHNKKISKRVYGKTREEVLAKMKKLLFEQQEGKLVIPSTTTVLEYLTTWLELYKKIELRQTTYTTYEICINKYIIPHIGNIKLQDLKLTDIQLMINKLFIGVGIDAEGKKKKGLAASTLRKIKFIISACLEKAIEEELITKNTAQKVKLPKFEKPEIKPLTVNDMQKIFEVVKNNQNMRIAILLDLATGLRRGELLALTWQDIDSVTGSIKINKQLVPIPGGTNIIKPKTTTSTRQVSIPPKVITELKRHKIYQLAQKVKMESDKKEYFETDLVVSQNNGKHFHPRTFASIFDRIQKKAGVQHRTIHDMRHTFATQLLSNGAYINEVQIALGHTDAKTTLQNYAHILPGRQKELANRMNNILPL